MVAGSDVVDATRRRFAEKFPSAKVYGDHRKLLKDTSVDAVLVAVPTLLHKPIVIDALRSSRPVLVEKPLARTVADARRMIDVAHKSRKLLMVAHCRRFDPHWSRFGRLVGAGTLGEPLIWRCVMGSCGPGGWYMDDRLGGGPLVDAGVHNYDFANGLFGDPIDVVARAIKLTTKSAIDTATAVVRYPRGHQLMLSWSWAVPGAAMMDALGPKGSVEFGPGAFASEIGDPSGKAFYCLRDVQGKKNLIQFRCDFGAMYRVQDRHFLECVQDKADCRSPGTEAIKAVAVAEAILNAACGRGALRVRW